MKEEIVNKKELKKQIQELRIKSADLSLESMRVNDQANSLEAQIEQIDREYWKPEIGEKYYFIYHYGVSVDENQLDDIDRLRIATSNCFPTEEQAQAKLDHDLALTRIRKYIYDEGLDFSPDWSDECQRKHYVFYDHEEQCFGVSYYNLHQPQATGNIYLSSTGDATRVIMDCEDDLRIVFGVEKQKDE